MDFIIVPYLCGLLNTGRREKRRTGCQDKTEKTVSGQEGTEAENGEESRKNGSKREYITNFGDK